MHFIEVFRHMEYLDFLIRNGATGSPANLAHKLDVSERQVYRIIDDLKAAGLPIVYSKARSSYLYSEEVYININISINEKKIIAIKSK
jgi:predicted DNA-binding transcriptional regulator YafY